MADTDLIAWEAEANMRVLLCMQDVSGLNHDFQTSYPAWGTSMSIERQYMIHYDHLLSQPS